MKIRWIVSAIAVFICITALEVASFNNGFNNGFNKGKSECIFKNCGWTEHKSAYLPKIECDITSDCAQLINKVCKPGRIRLYPDVETQKFYYECSK